MKNHQDSTAATPSGSIGVLMLDTRFPRFNGDIGNRHTWPFNVELSVVHGARASAVVGATSKQDLKPFIDAAVELQDKGVSAITTSCGFLSLAQSEIASHLSIPFIASSLMQVPWVQASLPASKRVGVLTIDASALSDAHLQAAGISLPIPVKGCESGQEFTNAIMSNASTMAYSLCQQENIDAARELIRENPDIGAIVLECTNMAPYANTIHTATGLPVYSIYTLICWLQSGLLPKVFNT